MMDALKEARKCWDKENPIESEESRYTRFPWIKDVLPFNDYAGKRVFEIGFGQGVDLMQFYRGGAIVIGIDASSEHYRVTAARFAAIGNTPILFNEDFLNTDLFRYPFFDFVYSNGVIHHMDDDFRAMRRLECLLRIGGKFTIIVYSLWSKFFWKQKLWQEGIRQGKLFTLGWKGLLATIEAPADGITAIPFVRLYTKRRLLRVCENANLKVDRIYKPTDFYLVVEGHLEKGE